MHLLGEGRRVADTLSAWKAEWFEPLTLILESIPLYALYELSILMAAAWGRPLGELSEEPAPEGSH